MTDKGQQQDVYPLGSYPQTGYPHPGQSQSDYAPQSSYPQAGYPQPGYPQGGYPQPAYPQAGYPQPGYPQGAYPHGGYAQPVYPHPMQADYGMAAANVASSQAGYAPPGEARVGDDEDVKGFDFTDKSIRKAFIRKVYSILMCQLLVTMGIMCAFMYTPGSRQWVQRNIYVFWIAVVVMVVCLISMACCTNVRRTFPTNFIFLGIFTLAMSFLLGVSATAYSRSEVLLAVGITAALCLALTLFAFQTRIDFTVMGGFLLCASVVLLIFGILVAIMGRGQILTIVYACCGALLFSFYLVYDTQLMMGGKHKYSISPEEYIFAALNLYLDIINIFLYILTIIGATRN